MNMGYNYTSFNTDLKIINQSGYEYIHDIKMEKQVNNNFGKTNCNVKKISKNKSKKNK